MADTGNRVDRRAGGLLDFGNADGDIVSGLGGLLRQRFDLLRTTEKPLPASPARAASIVALRASRLVWAAISSISCTMVPIRSVAVDRLPTVSRA
ncbi:hypothetical protein [Rhodopseudomonas palustris]|uniref:hypothetical protein n=1 Tax=Rhodopseudomonas palustris TaxID=1076 RepID=UPI001F25BBAC|nr:hypothetical protein [Rhodopseudomonas palustris]